MPALLFVVIAVLLAGPLSAADLQSEPPRHLPPEHPLRLYELRKIQAAPGDPLAGLPW